MINFIKFQEASEWLPVYVKQLKLPPIEMFGHAKMVALKQDLLKGFSKQLTGGTVTHLNRCPFKGFFKQLLTGGTVPIPADKYNTPQNSL